MTALPSPASVAVSQAEENFDQLCADFLASQDYAEDSDGVSREREIQSDALQSFAHFLFRGLPGHMERLAGLARTIPIESEETPKAQRQALLVLQSSLGPATETGLFDQMWDVTHPDVINKFCDAVQDMVMWTEPTAVALRLEKEIFGNAAPDPDLPA